MSMFVDYEGDVNDLLAQAEAAADPTALLQEVLEAPSTSDRLRLVLRRLQTARLRLSLS